MSTWCPLPFRHVFVEPRGIKPCCSYTKIADMSVAQWVGSKELATIQKNILSGAIDPGCVDCVSGEIKNGVSTRLGAIKDYGNEIMQDTCIDYVDYRSSNICNFRCRTCEPFYSIGIAQDVKRSDHLMTLYQLPPEKTATVSDHRWVIDNINQIKRLMFTGGEPTMLPEVREIIEHIQRNGLEVSIQIITNGSFRDTWWLDLARHSPNVNFTVSIDAVGPAAEIIRHGSTWSVIENNIRWLAEHGHSLNFSTVISSLNLFQLGPLLSFVREVRNQYSQPNGRTQFIQICQHPQYLSPLNWPMVLKDAAAQYIDTLIQLEDYQPTQQVLADLSENIKAHVYDPDLWAQGEHYNQEISRLRGEKHAWLYRPAF